MNASLEPGFGAKIALLWQTNKPLVIAAIAGIVLLIAAAIFAVVFFTVIKPAGDVPPVQDKPMVEGTATNNTTAPAK